MPMYSWYCRPCKKTRDEYFHVKDLPETVKCPKCGQDCKQDFEAKRPQAIQDTFDQPKDMSSIFGTVATSRSEAKALMRKYDEKHGTKLEFA